MQGQGGLLKLSLSISSPESPTHKCGPHDHLTLPGRRILPRAIRYPVLIRGRFGQALTPIRLAASHLIRVAPASCFEHSLLPTFRLVLVGEAIQIRLMNFRFSFVGGCSELCEQFEPPHKRPLEKTIIERRKCSLFRIAHALDQGRRAQADSALRAEVLFLDSHRGYRLTAPPESRDARPSRCSLPWPAAS